MISVSYKNKGQNCICERRVTSGIEETIKRKAATLIFFVQTERLHYIEITLTWKAVSDKFSVYFGPATNSMFVFLWYNVDQSVMGLVSNRTASMLSRAFNGCGVFPRLEHVEHLIITAKMKTNMENRELKQRRRRRQRERHKTIGLICKNNSSARAFYVLYISLPSSAKQQREMTKFKVLWRTWAHDGEFFILLPYLNAIP